MNTRYRLALALAALVTAAALAGAAAPVQVVYRGHIVTTPAPVLELRHGTLVPLRPVVTALGGRLAWNEAATVAMVRYGGRQLAVDLRTHTVRLDKERLRDLVVPCEVRGHLLVPLAAIERLFRVRGQWRPGRRELSFAPLPKPRPVIGRAASGGAGQPPPNTQPATAASGPLLTLTSDRQTYAVGAPVRLTMTVSNPARPTITLRFASGQQYDFEVRRGTQPIWRWSAGRMFTQALTSMTIGPGERRVFSETWNQRDNKGQPVQAGTYTAIATLTTMARPQPQTPPVTFRIGR
jgi:intracellular proteinase inhibitor BsuPI/copper amine oxidase-like protein